MIPRLRLLSSTPGGPAGPADPEANRPQDGLRSHLRVRFRTLPWASSGHVTTPIDVSATPMPTFATKLSTGANGQQEDASESCCGRSAAAVMSLLRPQCRRRTGAVAAAGPPSS